MTAAEYRAYLRRAIPAYAAAHRRIGDVDPRQALKRARADYAELLPKGLATPGHHLYSVVLLRTGKAIGIAWLELHRRHGRPKAFVFDIEIGSRYRGRGLGGEAFAALEAEALRLGAQAISLHVLADNTAARSLYEKRGFRYTSMGMAKELSS